MHSYGIWEEIQGSNQFSKQLLSKSLLSLVSGVTAFEIEQTL